LPSSVAVEPELEKFDRFCRALTLSQGRPMTLESYQRTMLGDYFDGVIETLILLQKKNGKTTLMAALALYHLLSTADAECVIGASSRDQATIMYDQACGFIRRSPGLQQRTNMKRGYREIRSVADSGRIRVLASDVDNVDGVIPTLALVDELGRHKKPDLYGIFRDGLGPRDGQMVTISTAGENGQSPLGVIRAAARKLPGEREGKYLHTRAGDDSFALHEWALDEADDCDDMRVVKLVNPASWQTVEALRRRHSSPSMMTWQWRRFACGLWQAAEAEWITPEDWWAHEEPTGLELGDSIAIGFDGSRYHDATALVGCRLEDGLLQVLGLWEAPPGAVEWEVPQGDVEATLAETFEDYRVVRGYFDPPLWQSEIDSWAREFGDKAVMRYHTNRARMMAATERFRTDLRSGQVPHVVDERLSDHVLNARLREARGGYWLSKAGGSELRIDAAVAAVLAYEARCDALAGDEHVDRGEFAFL
jgi:phage terminase large subunit-like protein